MTSSNAFPSMFAVSKKVFTSPQNMLIAIAGPG